MQVAIASANPTGGERYKPACPDIWPRCVAAGDIYKKTYQGLYCVGDEMFMKESELVDGRCPNHPHSELQKVEEENWFFALTKYKDWLKRFIDSNPDFIQPAHRRPEVLQSLEGLEDVSITRKDIPWGIPFPGDPDQKVYVWFDALLNYLGASDDADENYWPATVHVIGKDITRFHCLLWPAMLRAASVPYPASVYAHGFLYDGGQKVSKSGRAVSPQEILDEYGSEVYRYYFMSKCSFAHDGEYDKNQLLQTYNGELANNLGNLVHRAVGMTQKYFGGRLPSKPHHLMDSEYCKKWVDERWVRDFVSEMDNFNYVSALSRLRNVWNQTNEFITTTEPWTLFKEDKLDEVNMVIRSIVHALQITSVALAPFMPETARKVYEAFEYNGSNWEEFCQVNNLFESTVGFLSDEYIVNPNQLESGRCVPLFERK